MGLKAARVRIQPSPVHIPGNSRILPGPPLLWCGGCGPLPGVFRPGVGRMHNYFQTVTETMLVLWVTSVV
jgi:hypothetical protein